MTSAAGMADRTTGATGADRPVGDGPAPDGVDPALFRRVFGRFATGVTVVSTRLAGHDVAITANSVTSVSLEPLRVLVCVHEDSRFLEGVQESGSWGVSILAADARPSAEWLATSGRPLHGQLDRVPHHRSPVTQVAWLDGALAHLDCRLAAVHPSGDHSIVVGDVVGIGATDAAGAALVFYRSRYERLD